jgi:hypothetical protein
MASEVVGPINNVSYLIHSTKNYPILERFLFYIEALSYSLSLYAAASFQYPLSQFSTPLL